MTHLGKLILPLFFIFVNITAQDVRFLQTAELGTGAGEYIVTVSAVCPSGNCNLTGFTPHIYYDNTNFEITTFSSPLSDGQSWGTLYQQVEYPLINNPSIQSSHNGYFSYQNIDQNLVGIDVPDSPIPILVVHFVDIGVPHQFLCSGGIQLASIYEDGSVYLDNNFEGHPMVIDVTGDIILLDCYVELLGSPYSQVGSVNACKPTMIEAVGMFNSSNAVVGYVGPFPPLTAVLTNTLVSGTNSSWTVTYTYTILNYVGFDYNLQNQQYTIVGGDETPNLIYVKADADGVGDGSSWANAFTDLQVAIDQVCLCENPDSITIWVAAGSYYPTKDKNGDTSPTDSRTKTFYIDKDLKIYGGFQGNEDPASFDLSSRDFEANKTILSGDLMQNDTLNIPLDSLVVDGTRADNVYHVVWMYQLSANAELDGFTVRDGNGANTIGAGVLNEGAGSVSSPTISNCYFTYNSATSYGGAIFNGEGSSTTNPSLTACTFSYNWAERGAAIYNTSSAGGKSSPIVTNCVFTQHSGVFGGAVMNYAVSAESSPSFINCTFSNNTASQSGGAVYNWGHESGGISNTQIINCSFINNSAPYGAAMLNSATNTGTCSPVISNSIFWGNNASVAGSVLYNGSAVPEINYSLVDVANFDALKVGGGTHNVTGGTGMIYNEDPQFVDAASSNFNLGVCSPAIDTINFELVDIEGNMRKLKLSAGGSATIDMGAIEAKEILELDGCTICDSDSGECLSCFIENCITCISDSQCSECAPGFYLVGGVCVACTAVDHCTGEVTCTSDSDSQCSECAEGFVIAIDGTCVDLDACESNPCGPNAYCIDLPAPEVGGVCSCNDGFLGDGITCIPYRDTSIYLNAQGMAAIDTSYFYNGSSNNFEITSATLSKYSFSCDDIGPQSIVLTVNYNNPDPAYSSSSHTMIVTVIDTVRPIARCRNTTVYLDAQGVASIIDSSYINNGSSDNCDIKTASLSMSTFSCDDIGDQTVTLTVTDISGNINSCNATTTVIDIISPIIMCQDTTIYLDASGLFAIDSSYINNGSSDNCGIKTTSLSKSTFSCDDIGNQTVTLTATDVSDNVNSCISTVTVKDIEVTTPSITGEVTYCTFLPGVSYSVSDDINVDSYEWSYTGTGVTINSDNGASITIDFGAAATAGTLSVKLRSTCGIVDSANIVLTQAPPEVCSIIRCIEGNLLVSGEQLSLPNAPDIFKVTGILSADTIISSKLSFYAEQAIELFPGFSVAQSTVFLAAIEACEEE